jgi:hypothetical protein
MVSSGELPMAFKDRLGDRRSELRFEIIGQLWGSLDVTEHLPLRNLGPGGALVESRQPLSADTVHSVRLMIGDQPSELDVRVRHVTPVREALGDRFLIGLEFVNPGAVALEKIDRIVAAAMGQPSIPEA